MVKRKNHVRWALLVVCLLTFLSGGCGGSSDSSESNISFYSLSGTWAPHRGSGTAWGGGYNFRIQLSSPPGLITIDVLNATREDAAIEIDSEINWDFYYQDVHFSSVHLGLVGKQKIIIQRIGKNTFQFKTEDGPTVSARFTSDTTLDIEESGIYEDPEAGAVSYSVKYSLIKENPEPQ